MSDEEEIPPNGDLGDLGDLGDGTMTAAEANGLPLESKHPRSALEAVGIPVPAATAAIIAATLGPVQ